MMCKMPPAQAFSASGGCIIHVNTNTQVYEHRIAYLFPLTIYNNLPNRCYILRKHPPTHFRCFYLGYKNEKHIREDDRLQSPQQPTRRDHRKQRSSVNLAAIL